MSILNKANEEKVFGVFLKMASVIKYKLNYFCLKLLCAKVGKNVKVISIPKITGGRNINIGDNVFIGRNVYLVAGEKASLNIGNDVEIRNGVRIYARKIVIEANVTLGEDVFLIGNIFIKEGCWVSRKCDISGDVEIGCSILGPGVTCVFDDHARTKDGSVSMESAGFDKKIIIESGSWLGVNSIILKGVVIKKNVIVGAGSVVTKTFPEGSVIAGVPAEIIKSRLSIN